MRFKIVSIENTQGLNFPKIELKLLAMCMISYSKTLDFIFTTFRTVLQYSSIVKGLPNLPNWKKLYKKTRQFVCGFILYLAKRKFFSYLETYQARKIFNLPLVWIFALANKDTCSKPNPGRRKFVR